MLVLLIFYFAPKRSKVTSSSPLGERKPIGQVRGWSLWHVLFFASAKLVNSVNLSKHSCSFIVFYSYIKRFFVNFALKIEKIDVAL